MYKDSFTKFIKATNLTGSNKADSYIKAMDLLCKMLKAVPFSFKDCTNVWAISSSQRVHELYEFVLQESKKGSSSLWVIDGIPQSYLLKGYCSAALKSYEAFLFEKQLENNMVKKFNSHKDEERQVLKNINIILEYPEYLMEGIEAKRGEDIIRAVRTRVNQNVFRKIILLNYKNSCCITGLNIPEINRASHIIPWAADETKRLDPSNGLCLSATYDVAFDRHLIGLDDDYRIIISKKLYEKSKEKSVKDFFIKKEGLQINLPKIFKPNKNYLAKHREQGEF